MMYYIFSVCDFCDFWWILPWLLPFLLGLGLGWAWWANWKNKYSKLESDYTSLNSKHSRCSTDLDESNRLRMKLEEDLNLNKKAHGDLQLQLSTLKAQKADDSKLKTLQSDLALMSSSNEKIKSDLDECKSSNKTLKSELDQNVNNVANLQKELDALKKTNEDLETKNKALLTDISTKDSELGKLTSSLAAATALAAKQSEAKEIEKPKAATRPSPFAKLKEDNLQIIEGIGPKMESVLHDANINSWSKLGTLSSDEVRSILDSHGDKYKIIDPTTWPQQAKLAADGKWEELIQLQKELDGGSENAIGLTDSKLEKLIQTSSSKYKKYKKEDLTIVEGIGPKISELLHNAGINNWNDLANSTADRIKEILDAAGSRFKLAEPRTWPQQAKLADEGKWNELEDLQDKLDGGK